MSQTSPKLEKIPEIKLDFGIQFWDRKLMMLSRLRWWFKQWTYSDLWRDVLIPQWRHCYPYTDSWFFIWPPNLEEVKLALKVRVATRWEPGRHKELFSGHFHESTRDLFIFSQNTSSWSNLFTQGTVLESRLNDQMSISVWALSIPMELAEANIQTTTISRQFLLWERKIELDDPEPLTQCGSWNPSKAGQHTAALLSLKSLSMWNICWWWNNIRGRWWFMQHRGGGLTVVPCHPSPCFRVLTVAHFWERRVLYAKSLPHP